VSQPHFPSLAHIIGASLAQRIRPRNVKLSRTFLTRVATVLLLTTVVLYVKQTKGRQYCESTTFSITGAAYLTEKREMFSEFPN
jgi:hypothetical protein